MPLRTAACFCVVCTLAVLTLPAGAQSAGVYVDIGPCMAMENDTDRYACYDRLEEQVRQAQAREEARKKLPAVSIPRNTRQVRQEESSGEAVDDTQVAVQEDDQDDEIDKFGASSPAATRVRENDEGDKELVDTVTDLAERAPDQWLISLAGGQKWLQLNSKRFRLRKGMEVRIYPSPFGGSYRLSTSSINGFIQVRRVK